MQRHLDDHPIFWNKKSVLIILIGAVPESAEADRRAAPGRFVPVPRDFKSRGTGDCNYQNNSVFFNSSHEFFNIR